MNTNKFVLKKSGEKIVNKFTQTFVQRTFWWLPKGIGLIPSFDPERYYTPKNEPKKKL